jgi:transcriptional regulator with XRE-family HTH domain
MKSSPTLAANIRFLRRRSGDTQSDLARKLGVGRAALGAYEEGRAEPRLPVLLQLADLLGCSVDDLLRRDLSAGQQPRRLVDVAGERLRVLPVPVGEQDGEERISIVPVQAAAGYLEGHRDLDFVAQLPAFQLPVPELSAQRSYRLFQIKGDSMLPLPNGAYVIAAYVQDWRSLRDYQSCVVVSKNEGVVYKRVKQHWEAGYVELRSDNPAYAPYRLASEEVLEIWKAVGYLSFSLPEPGEVAPDMQYLLQELRMLVQNNKLGAG